MKEIIMHHPERDVEFPYIYIFIYLYMGKIHSTRDCSYSYMCIS
jgi:hypothetical protein